MTKLYVGNISFKTQEDELKGLFETKGEVLSVKILKDRDTGRSRGIGFVEMSSDEAAQAAIDELNGQEFQGRNLKVNVAMDKPRREGGGGGGRGGFGGGGGRRDNNRGGGSWGR